ncbi:hypothetical protein K501DRAFT_319419 [Backusella circina FSU 941]|nr:hypothetical protein K501DRAFT_319419 [Backusella circina FSU 941]
MSQEYGTTNRQDEEAPLVSGERQTCVQKFKRLLDFHGHRILATWIIVIAITAVLTLSFHFAYKHSHPVPKIPEDGLLLDDMCVSDRSWFVALMLSIFLGPFGVDRFYLGYIFLGVLKLVTAGLGGIWWAVDVILIALNVLNDHPNGCHLD